MEEKKEELETVEENNVEFVEEPEFVAGEEEKTDEVIQEPEEIVEEKTEEEQKDEFNKEPEEKKCIGCGEMIGFNQKFCPKCGKNQEEKTGTFCPECGAELSPDIKFCDKCGHKMINEEVNNSNTTQQPKKSHTLAIVLSIIGGILLLLLIIGVAVGISVSNKVKAVEEYKNTPVKVDISMSNYYGNIDYILEDFGLDFDLVTKGGNCYSGVQTGTFETEKYGVLHTEYSYCKSNQTLTFRLYNLEKDQKLREPDSGEVPTYDEYGKRTSDYSV